MRPLLLLACALALSACDRPVVGPDAPDIEVVSPDLSQVQTERSIRLEISARSLQGVQQLTVNGDDAAFNQETRLWEIDVFLASGADILVLDAFSSDGATATDTAHVVQLDLNVGAPSPILPEARAGHTGTRVAQGVLLAGGANENGQVHDTARLITESGFVFAFGDAIALGSRRTGHTGTRLLDGRALLLGGTSDLSPEGPADFVTQPEVVDPTTRTVRPVVYRDGPPVRRTGHTTVLLDRNDRQYLYVIGGRIPTGSGLSTSSTVDILEFRPGVAADTLVVLSPDTGASGPAGLADATQIVLAEQPNLFTSLLTGLPSGATPEAQRVRYEAPGASFPFRIEPGAVASPAVPRTGADGVRIGFGLGLLVGGADASGTPRATLDVYGDRAGRFFRFPAGIQLGFGRRDHTVTLAPSGRILVTGGQNGNGQALQTLEVLSF